MSKSSPDSKKSHVKQVDNKRQVNLLDVKGNRSSRNGIYLFAVIVFLAFFCSTLGAFLLANAFTLWAIIIATAVGILAASTIRTVQHWEKAVVLRLGK